MFIHFPSLGFVYYPSLDGKHHMFESILMSPIKFDLWKNPLQERGAQKVADLKGDAGKAM